MLLARQSGRKIMDAVRIPCANYNMSSEKDRWKNRIAVVTGAGMGIGKAIVAEMIKNKIMVVGLDIRMDKMDELYAQLPKKSQPYFQPIECDVSKQDTVNKIFDCICRNFGGVDIMVNNAGVLVPGQILTLDGKQVKKVMNTNVLGTVYCTQRAYKSMTERKFEGHIFNICSVAGHIVSSYPPDKLLNTNMYSSSKFAVKAISETLRHELRGLKRKIKITNISPGNTDTAMLLDTMKSETKLKPGDIAAGVMFALFSPPNVNIYEITIKPVGEQF